MQQTSDRLRSWFKSVLPVYPELFNAAYAMCGNDDLAEYALRCALLEVWLQGSDAGAALRERLRGSLRREAFAAALSEEGQTAEFTWPGLPPAREGDALQAQLCRESTELQRLAVLRYGCGLSLRAACRLTDYRPGQGRAELRRMLSRCRKALPAADRAHADSLVARRLKRSLSLQGPDLPHPARVCHALEAEAAGASGSGRRLSRLFAALLTAAFALLCAGAFWLFAVLMQPSQF